MYAGLLDGRLVALDAETGRVDWAVQTTPPGSDYSITGAPRNGQSTSSGPLAGVEGALSLDSELMRPGESNLGIAYNLSNTQEMRLQALQQMIENVQEETVVDRADLRFDLEGEDEEAVERDLQALPPKRRRRVRVKRDRLPVMLLLLVVAAPAQTVN